MGNFNGSGVFVRSYNWTNDAANGIDILAARMDTEDDGFAAGLSNCITRDGQSPPTTNIPMGGFKLTGLGAASAPTDTPQFQQVLPITGGTITGGISVQGTISAQTPNSGSTGGIQLLANATSGLAYFQILNSTGSTQWAQWNVNAAGLFSYSGAIAGGGTITAATRYIAPIGITYTFTGDTVTGYGSNTAGVLDLYANNNSRIRVKNNGYVMFYGALGASGYSGNDIPGSGNSRFSTDTSGGTAMSTYDAVNYTAAQFVRAIAGTPTQIGAITVTDTAVTYGSISDYRVKADVKTITAASAWARLSQLRPVDYLPTQGGTQRLLSFIAHEVQPIYPPAVVGQKDGPTLQNLDKANFIPDIIATLLDINARLIAHGI